MNNDLISRSALIAEHCDGCDAFTHGLCDHDVCGVAQLIMEAPAVDAVPVIRCKDCKLTAKTKSQPKILYWCNKFGNVMRPDDYCSFGERKGDGA